MRWHWTSDGRGEAERLGLDWHSTALAVSRDGRVIIGWTIHDSRGFWWTPETGPEPVGDLPGGGADTWPRALSADGKVIVGQAISRSGKEAFRWTQEDGMTGLGDLPGAQFSSDALGILSDGKIIVGRGHGSRLGKSGQGDRAFIWDAKRGMRDLHSLLLEQGKIGESLPRDFDKWRLQNSVGVRATSDGRLQVAGTARNGGGARVPYVATLAEAIAD